MLKLVQLVLIYGLMAMSLASIIGALLVRPPYVLDLASNFVPWLGVLALICGLPGTVRAIGARPRRGALPGMGLVALGVALLALWLAYWTPMVRPAPADEDQRVLRIAFINAWSTRNDDIDRLADWLESTSPDAMLMVATNRSWSQHPRLAAMYEYRTFLSGETTVLSHFPFRRPDLWDPETYREYHLPVHRPWIFELEDGRKVFISVVRPPSPRTPQTWRANWIGVEKAGQTYREQSEKYPVIVIGDFNATPTSRSGRTFARGSQLRRVGTHPWNAGSWPSILPRWLSLPLDQVWVDHTIGIQDFRIGPPVGSDHRPVLVDVVLPEPK
ncbi:MAG: endonuclease/exonuclease/phosphatase family protein [Phycisphaeraceae bacterium]|nr:endonuclease/exonuclease/phosphatase family protein [Phycisphaeraceae bacterium]